MIENNQTTNCDACGGIISKVAEKCPHCGNPVNQGYHFLKTIGGLCLLILFYMFLAS